MFQSAKSSQLNKLLLGEITSCMEKEKLNLDTKAGKNCEPNLTKILKEAN